MRGYVDETELGELYSGALAAVFPSLYEGFHLPALDAASLGCPVIASDIPVHREVLGDAALYCPPHDRDALVAQVRRLASDVGLRQRLASLGIAQARRFDWTQSARTLADVIRGVTKRS
jgi:glycosyltransferase involved in cell wall biosynthesis